jgi:ligand-binding SRPBCC domain-containing protein
MITDTVEYSMPFGPLGQLVDWLVVSADLKRLFDYRYKITRQDLEAK